MAETPMEDMMDQMPETPMEEQGDQGPSIPPEMAKYRPADSDQTCGNCGFFKAPGACQVVMGKIDPAWTCDLWRGGGEEGLPDTAIPGLEAQLFGGENG